MLTRIMLVAVFLLPVAVHAQLFFSPPDGKNIIDVNQAAGYLYRIEENIYVQTQNETFLKEVAALMHQLKKSRTGSRLISQVNNYHPLSLPYEQPAKAFDIDFATETQVHVVIREPEAGKTFTTEALLSDSTLFRNQANGLGVPAVVYFDTKHTIMIPGTSSKFDAAVALGHELVHARDYLTGNITNKKIPVQKALPIDGKQDSRGEVVSFDLAHREYEATGIAYNKGEDSLGVKELTSERINAIKRREQYKEIWEDALKNKQVTKKEYQCVVNNLALLKKESPVSEFHLALELKAPTRDMYWPQQLIDYTLVDAPNILSFNALRSRLQLSSLNTSPDVFKNMIPFLEKGQKQAVVMTYGYIGVGDQKLPLSAIDNNVLRLAGKGGYNVYLVVPSGLDAADENMLNAVLLARRKLLASIDKKGVSQIHLLRFHEGQLSGDGIEILETATHTALFGVKDELASLEVAELLSQRGQELMISRINSKLLPLDVVDFTAYQRWANLAKRANLKMLASGGLPSIRRCWRNPL